MSLPRKEVDRVADKPDAGSLAGKSAQERTALPEH